MVEFADLAREPREPAAPDRLARLRGGPGPLRVDSGPEFAGRLLDQRACMKKVELDVSPPGKPANNVLIEAFNSRLRQECLNASWFLSMASARARIDEGRCDSNRTRPRSAVGGLTPAEFAAHLKPARKVARNPDKARGEVQGVGAMAETGARPRVRTPCAAESR